MKTPIALSALVLALVLTGPGWAASPDSTAGTVIFVDGEVTANGREAETGDLFSGPVVFKTGKGAVLEVIFGGRNIFRLGANTVAQVDFSTLGKTVNLEKGSFTSVLKKLGQVAGSSSFLLKTPTVNAGVRGTSFHVTADEDSSYFCTCNGSVDLEDALGGNGVNLTNAHHGSRIFARDAGGTITVTEGGLEDHTDASIETLASRIAVAVDWTQPDLKHE